MSASLRLAALIAFTDDRVLSTLPCWSRLIAKIRARQIGQAVPFNVIEHHTFQVFQLISVAHGSDLRDIKDITGESVKTSLTTA